MLLQEEPGHNKTFNKILLIVAGALLLGYMIYKTYIVYTSEERFTIAEVVDRASNSKSSGALIKYMANGDTLYKECFVHICEESSVGERILISYFVDDTPHWV